MSVAFELTAEPRSEIGKGASRRLRRNGRIPAVLYGGGQSPQPLSLEHREVLRALENEAFYSHVLQIKLGSRTEQAILRDLQRHPYKPAVLHIDLQRVVAHEKVRVHVPLHFINEATAIGVKQQGGAVSHFRIEVEVSCLPKDLPEFIEVDLSNLSLGESIYLSQLKLPEGVEIVELAHDSEYDAPVASIHGQRGGEEEGGVEGGPAGESSVP